MVVAERLVRRPNLLELGGMALVLPALDMPAIKRIEEADMRHHAFGTAVAITALKIEHEAEGAHIRLAELQLARLGLEGEIHLEADRPAPAEGEPLQGDVLRPGPRARGDLQRIGSRKTPVRAGIPVRQRR